MDCTSLTNDKYPGDLAAISRWPPRAAFSRPADRANGGADRPRSAFGAIEPMGRADRARIDAPFLVIPDGWPPDAAGWEAAIPSAARECLRGAAAGWVFLSVTVPDSGSRSRCAPLSLAPPSRRSTRRL